MKVIRASAMGLCFGVRDALAYTKGMVGLRPLTVLGELVHNEVVNAGLRKAGVAFAQTPEEVKTEAVLVTAHGASNRRISDLKERGLFVLESTCPLVRLAHSAALRLAGSGHHVIVVGKKDHAEVRGLVGDLDDYSVVLADEDVENVPERPRYGVISQTTQPLTRVRHLMEKLQEKYPSSKCEFTDTVCRPTKERQRAVEELALTCRLIVVVGGKNSNNTSELAKTCESLGAKVRLVQSEADLNPQWFRGIDQVGLTAGTSTPDETIRAVEERLKHF